MLVQIALLAVLAAEGPPASASPPEPKVSAPAAAAAPAPQPPRTLKLGAPGLTSVNLDEKVARFYSDHFAQQLSLGGVRVITASEMSALLGLEKQKQLMGCSESSCVAELANALGVDGLVTGSIGKFGNAYQINVKVLAASDGTPLGIYSARVEGDEKLLDELTHTARQLAAEMLKKLNRAPVQVTQIESTGENAGPRRSGSILPVIGGMGGGVLVTIGGAVGILSLGISAGVQSGQPRSFVDAKAQSRTASGLGTTSLVLLGAGVGLVAWSAYATIHGAGEPAPKAALVPMVGPGGFGLAVGGVIP